MRTEKERLCVVMPVYNERDVIGQVLTKWQAVLSRLEIDFVLRPYNDGSMDDSLAVIKSVAKSHSHIEVIDKPNGGHGNTILTGYRQAAVDGFDWVFQVDSDDEMEPERFVELWKHRADYDFLVGIRDGRIQQLPRKVISFVSRLCVRLFFGKSVWDVNAPYRLMRVSRFADFYRQIPLSTFAPNVILSGLAARSRLRCFEMRVPQHDRTTGEVSIRKWKLMKAAAKSFWQTIAFAFHDDGRARMWWLFGAVAVAAVAGRFATSRFGWTFDYDSYEIVAGILERGGNVYAETHRYNYGPIWFLVLGTLKFLFGSWYRFGIVSFLALVDVGVGAILWKKRLYLPAMLFLMSYTSMYITGYCLQFDNFAILVCLLGACILDRSRGNRVTFFWGAVLIGVSITIKHIFAFLPFWMLFRNWSWRKRLVAALVPLVFFAFSFLPFVGPHPIQDVREMARIAQKAVSDHSGAPLRERLERVVRAEGITGETQPVLGIARHCFMYKGIKDAKVFYRLIPMPVRRLFPAVAIFVGGVLLAGWWFRRYSLFDGALAYTAILFACATATARNYFAIPCVACSVWWWPFGLIYQLMTGLAFAFHFDDAMLQFPFMLAVSLVLVVMVVWRVRREEAKR